MHFVEAASTPLDHGDSRYGVLDNSSVIYTTESSPSIPSAVSAKGDVQFRRHRSLGKFLALGLKASRYAGTSDSDCIRELNLTDDWQIPPGGTSPPHTGLHCALLPGESCKLARTFEDHDWGTRDGHPNQYGARIHVTRQLAGLRNVTLLSRI